ncbi:TadE/TadG family type IV pilus assembly protein [Rhizobium sp. FKL33]|uniref:TadE/TadG family type IV pilus assembly protein n=1 Tax=Rhizobium sp. FKL33 TaxID=2562307 RepID=UPI0014851579|nr:TadE/TadG family type IV pilus assembly protein [Rhizobium sp. FKL33]
MPSIVQRFRKDRSGVSAIEFVLIFPILVALLAGTVDFGQALMVSRKMNQIVSTLGDMIAQKSSWTTSEANAIITGTTTIILPFSTTNLKIKLAVVDVASDLSTKVNWGLAYQDTAPSKNGASPVTVPTTIAQSGVQLVTVVATYQLTTPFSSLLQPVTGVSTYNYSKTYIMRPRVKDTITLD